MADRHKRIKLQGGVILKFKIWEIMKYAREELLKWFYRRSFSKNLSSINTWLGWLTVLECVVCNLPVIYEGLLYTLTTFPLSPTVMLHVMICFFFDSHVSLVCDHYLNRAVAYHGSRPIITQWHRPLWPVLDIMSRLLGDFRAFVCSQNPRGSRNLLTKSIKDYP